MMCRFASVHNDVFSSLPECSIPAAAAGFEPLLSCMPQPASSCANTRSPAKAFPLMRMCQVLLKRSRKAQLLYTAAGHCKPELVPTLPPPPATRRVFLQWLCPAEKVRKNCYLCQRPNQARGRHHEDRSRRPQLASIRWGGRLTSPSLGTGEAWCQRCPCTEQQVQQGT